MELYRINLQLFANAGSVVNTTTGTANAYTGAVTTSTAMSPTMKTYYDTELLENAREKLIFSQLGKKQPLPRKHGKTVEWRKWRTFEKALTPLVEGVIPTGQTFGIDAINVTIHQHGDYTAISDVLDMHAIDNVILGATEEMGAAAGATIDTLTRNELCTGTNVMYCDTTSSGVPVSTPTGHYAMTAANNRLTPDMVNKAKTFLRKCKAPYFEGSNYVAVIHPSVAYDLRSSEGWIEAHKYAATKEIFNGEIGMLHGVRFIENTEAKVHVGENLFSSTQRYLSVSAKSNSATDTSADFGVVSAYRVTVSETITDAIGASLIGRKVNFYETGESSPFTGTSTIVGVKKSSGYIYVSDSIPANVASGDKLYPGEGGASTGKCAIYDTLFFGKDAFGDVEPEGMGMEMIIKSRDEVGGPLDQFSTVGYKFETACKILYQERLLRVESCSAYSTVDDEN